ncbi:MAG: hypothetical protein V8S08_02520 [Lachnoclostridium sp.]
MKTLKLSLLLPEATRRRSSAGDALDEVNQQEAVLQEHKEQQLEAGKEQLEALQAQLNARVLTLAQARGQLSSAQIEAAAGISQGAAQAAVGETALSQQESQFDTHLRKRLYEKADMTGILNAGYREDISRSPEFPYACRICK